MRDSQPGVGKDEAVVSAQPALEAVAEETEVLAKAVAPKSAEGLEKSLPEKALADAAQQPVQEIHLTVDNDSGEFEQLLADNGLILIAGRTNILDEGQPIVTRGRALKKPLSDGRKESKNRF